MAVVQNHKGFSESFTLTIFGLGVSYRGQATYSSWSDNGCTDLGSNKISHHPITELKNLELQLLLHVACGVEGVRDGFERRSRFARALRKSISGE